VPAAIPTTPVKPAGGGSAGTFVTSPLLNLQRAEHLMHGQHFFGRRAQLDSSLVKFLGSLLATALQGGFATSFID
jgi:hypothetical protein